jgi:predicted DsbA family dithiol-disulfide isomerase
MSTSPTLSIQIWSDIACPWCYVGKRRFEEALAKFAHADNVTIRWRAFELDPSAARTTSHGKGGYAERLARKYGFSVADAEARLDAMTKTAADVGLDFRFDHIKSGNTFDAHRLLHFADKKELGGALKERLLRGYFTDGESMGDIDALVRLAGEVGLETDEARAVLTSDLYAAEVRDDERQARSLGINGVPFFVIGRYGVSGAQSPEVLLGALQKAWSESPEVAVADSESCGVDGC